MKSFQRPQLNIRCVGRILFAGKRTQFGVGVEFSDAFFPADAQPQGHVLQKRIQLRQRHSEQLLAVFVTGLVQLGGQFIVICHVFEV